MSQSDGFVLARAALASRASFSSTACRMKSDRRFAPTTASIASMVACASRMVVSFIPSGLRPIRRGVSEIARAVNLASVRHLKAIAETAINDTHYSVLCGGRP